MRVLHGHLRADFRNFNVARMVAVQPGTERFAPRRAAPLNDVITRRRGGRDRVLRLTQIQRQRVDAPDQIGAQHLMQAAVAGQARQPGEFGGPQADVEMRLAALAPAGVAAVAFAVVAHLKLGRVHRRQPVAHLICYGHFSPPRAVVVRFVVRFPGGSPFPCLTISLDC